MNDYPVSIRRFRPDDAPSLFNAVRESLDELCAFMTWCHPDYSLEDSRDFIARSVSDWEKGEQYNFAIIDLSDESLLGSIGLNRIDRVHMSANIGYWVRRSHTRHGVATAATRLIVGFGLKELGFHRLELLVSDHNVASRRVVEKVGAKSEGVLRKRLVLANRLHDAFVYSLVAADLTGDSDERDRDSGVKVIGPRSKPKPPL
ncbi:MAG: GNAT family N-acetyltransferase [Candidatus Acidiferrales bacterium]